MGNVQVCNTETCALTEFNIPGTAFRVLHADQIFLSLLPRTSPHVGFSRYG